MKIFRVCLICFGGLVLAAVFLTKPVLIKTVEGIIKNALGAQASVTDCAVWPPGRLSLIGLGVSKGEDFTVQADQVVVRYNFRSIFTRNIPYLGVAGARIHIDLPQENIFERAGDQGSGNIPELPVGRISLEDISFDVKAKDIKAEGRISGDIGTAPMSLARIDMVVSKLESYGIVVEDVRVNAREGEPEGALNIGLVKFNKIKVSEGHSRIRFSGMEVLGDEVSARVFDGKVSGHFSVNLQRGPEYRAVFMFEHLQLAQLVKDLELEKKFTMSGHLGGRLTIQGKGPHCEIIDGGFAVSPEGGVLVIKDTRMLETLARRTDQPLDIIVESFRNYHYNTGNITLSLEENNLILNMALDGDTGKRDLNVVVHEAVPQAKEGL